MSISGYTVKEKAFIFLGLFASLYHFPSFFFHVWWTSKWKDPWIVLLGSFPPVWVNNLRWSTIHALWLCSSLGGLPPRYLTWLLSQIYQVIRNSIWIYSKKSFISGCENKRTTLTSVRYGFTVISSILVYLTTWVFFGLGDGNQAIGHEDADKFRWGI